jgi:5-methylcytosine-specific restriction endonuclease McrA
MSETKTCSKCKQELPITREFFYGDKRSKDGLVSCCKICHLQASARWRANNREKALEISRHWRENNQEKMQEARDQWADANKDRIRETKKARRLAHPELFRQRQIEFRVNNPNYNQNYARNWRKQNPTRTRDIKRQYRFNHPERVRISNRNRYARIKGAEGKHTEADVIQQLELQNYQCCWCYKSVRDAYTVDHLISLDRGGSNGAENIVIACASCNSSKGNRHVFFEWLPPYLFMTENK